jgi:GDP-L-fucose synthase
MNYQDKIYIAGHNGLVGSAIHRTLKAQGYTNLITRERKEPDLLDQHQVADFFQKEKPDYVFLAAARVGGIMANKNYPADFIYQNLQIQNNIIHNAYLSNVGKLLFLGSSCIYPKYADQPIKEDSLLTGELEPTNEPYAIAKIAGIKMCQSYNRQHGTEFISAMPTNLYGPGDNFDPETSHVLPALIRKFHEAKENGQEKVTLWGTGSPKREFLYVDDLADACVFLMNNYNPFRQAQDEKDEPINVGTGQDISIKELAEMIKEITGFQGEIEWDTSKPDGTPRKLLDVGRLHNLGWQHQTELEDGIRKAYEWYLNNFQN